MREEHLRFVVCPACRASLELRARERTGPLVKSGVLGCRACGREFPILDHIPRFTALDNYAASFGLEWKKHSRTQYDSYSGVSASEKRFFEETGWSRDLAGQIILEAGGGSGRFTEQAAGTGAMVISFDYSRSVEANYASNGSRENVFILQADIYRPPLPESFFDKIFCLGVLQHTPDVRRAFLTLPRFLKDGGRIVVDVYRRFGGWKGLLKTKYWVRPVTKRMKPETLYRLTEKYVRLMWPLSRLIHKLPLGKLINWALFIADYRGVYDLSEEILKEWAILDSFDMLSPAHDHPQTLEAVRRWFSEAGLADIDVRYGFNGIVGRGSKSR